AEGYALVAEHRGDYQESFARWQRVQKRFPGSWTAHVNPARTLRELGRFSEAEVLLKQATSRFPETIHGWLESARLAEDIKDWAVAKARWRQVSNRFQHASGALGQIRAMVALGQTEEAESFLLDMRTRFEYEPEIAMAWAHNAERRGDVELALGRWANVRRRFPQFILGYQESARLLRATRNIPELEALLRDATERFPSMVWPFNDEA